MSDDFDKQDDDFDWLNDDDDDQSSDESGITGELSWLDDAESSPDAKKSGDTDDLELDWLSQGDDDSAPLSEDATGVTGELSWLSDDDVADSPDAQASFDDGDWVQSGEERATTDNLDDTPDWLQSDDTEDEKGQTDELDEQPHGILDRFDTDSEDTSFDDGESSSSSDQSPDWLGNMGQTGALSEDHHDDHPAWLNDTGTFSQEQINRQLNAMENEEKFGGDDDDVASPPDEVPDWLSGAMFDDSASDDSSAESPEMPDMDSLFGSGDDDSSAESLEMPDMDTLFGFSGDSDATESPEIPDLDTMFGFDDDAFDDDDVAEPIVEDTSTDWMTQYEDDDEFGERPTEAIESDIIEDEPAEIDTGWLNYDDDDSGVEEAYDPYTQYDDAGTDDDDEYEDIFAPGTPIDTDMLTSDAGTADDDDEYEDIFASGTPIDTDMLTSESNLFNAEQPVSEPVDHDETPDWLSGFDDDDFGVSDEPTPTEATPQSDTDSWLEQFGDESFDDVGMGEPTVDPLDDVPDWLKGDVVGELSLSSQSGELRCRCFVSWDIMKPIQDAR